MLSAPLGGRSPPPVTPTEQPSARPNLSGVPVALLVELDSGQTLFSREADRRFIPASITKIMSAYVAFEMLDAGEIALDDEFTMSAAAHEEWFRKGSNMFLRKGDAVRVEDLLRGITSVSANDGAIVLAEGAAGSVDNWVARMNAKARMLGMYNSHFGTPNGWPDGGRTFTTARDLQKLARALISRHPAKFARFFGQDGFAYNGVAQANRDPITGVVEGADGIKTGYTRQAGNGFVGTAKRGGRRLLMVVAAVDDFAVRNRASGELIEWGFEAFGQTQGYDRGEKVAEARVQNGEVDIVPLVAPMPIEIARSQGGGKVALAIHYDGPLRAPIATGENVAELEVRVDGLTPFRVPLVAGKNVGRATLWRRLLNGLSGLF